MRFFLVDRRCAVVFFMGICEQVSRGWFMNPMNEFFLSNCVWLCGFVPAHEGVDLDARKFNTRSVVLNFFSGASNAKPR